MKTTIDFENNTWTCRVKIWEYCGSFAYRLDTKDVQVDWGTPKPFNWEEIENDIYLEVIANF